MTAEFNDAAEIAEGADMVGDEDGDERAPGWKQRADDLRRSQGPKRGKGYGYRRDS